MFWIPVFDQCYTSLKFTLNYQIWTILFYLVIIFQAERLFSEARSLEPYHLEGMEIFSTALWHLQREVELSALAQEMTDMEKNSPEVIIEYIIWF